MALGEMALGGMAFRKDLKAKWLLGEMAIRRNGNKPIIILIKPYR
jgi:hypothetical protein